MGLEWLLSAQEPGGGFHNATCQERYGPYGTNWPERMATYRVGEVGTIATGRAVRTLAFTSVLYRPHDTAFAERLLEAARASSTKIDLKFDFDGLPLAFHLTGGEASDSRNFAILLDIGPDITPRAVLGDNGYDARANREAARRRGICPAIPYRENAAAKPAFFST